MNPHPHPHPFRPLLASAGPPTGRSTPPGSRLISAALLARPVLVIEDEAMIAWMLESLLEDMGFTDIAIASTGEAAIAQAARSQPALILSDINLGPDGLDGIGAVAAILRGGVPSVIFISAYASDSAQRRIACEITGAVLLRKPVEARELEQAISRLDARHSHS